MSKKTTSETVKRLYVLDYGLFQVHENNRIIGIVGYLIQTHEGNNILVDTGFPARYAEDPEGASTDDNLGSFGHVLKLTKNNLAGGQLATVGLASKDINWLILTHSDVDHVGAIADFPQATMIIGAAERALTRPRYFGDRSPIEWPQMDYRLIEEDTTLCPGIRLLTSPGHSPGHLSLIVRLPETGTILIAGDAISRPEELDTGNGGAWDKTLAFASAKRLMAIAEQEQAMVLYGHDPAQWPTLRKAPQFYG